MKYIITLFVLLLFCNTAKADYYFYERITKEFRADTAKIEQQIRDMLEVDYTTMGMIEASREYEKGYDILLNKYYKVLIEMLDEDEKKFARQAQRNWIKQRDSDKELIVTLLRKEEGTMWSVVAANMQANITKERVITLLEYIRFGDAYTR